MKKKLMILGGSRYIIPVIEAAHKLNCHVITCDYLPDNIAHRYSDEYHNASIIDKEAILSIAQALNIDGIMSFAADPGVLTAAFVAESMELPFQGSFESIKILQNKDMFRAFLADNDFNCPQAFCLTSVGQAMQLADCFPYPVISKPVDSAGSKGVSRVDNPVELKAAVEYALSFSLSGACIVEQFIEKSGASSDADGFFVKGCLECLSFTEQLFDSSSENPYVPAAYCMPTAMKDEHQYQLLSDLQRLASLLQLEDGIFNIETRIGLDGNPYIMEMAPRGGGNRLAEMLRFASGVDLIKASVQVATRNTVDAVCMPVYDGFWYQLMLHSAKDGIFQEIVFSGDFEKKHVVDFSPWIEPGSPVSSFTAANQAFGSIILRFEKKNELEEFLTAPEEFMQVVLTEA